MQLPPSADLLIPVGVGVLVAVVAVVALMIGLRRRTDDVSVPTHADWTGEHVGDVAAPPTRTVADAVAARQGNTGPFRVASSAADGPARGGEAVKRPALPLSVRGSEVSTSVPGAGWPRHTVHVGAPATSGALAAGAAPTAVSDAPPTAANGATPAPATVVTAEARHCRSADDGERPTYPSDPLFGAGWSDEVGRHWFGSQAHQGGPSAAGAAERRPGSPDELPEQRSDKAVDRRPDNGQAASSPSGEPAGPGRPDDRPDNPRTDPAHPLAAPLRPAVGAEQLVRGRAADGCESTPETARSIEDRPVAGRAGSTPPADPRSAPDGTTDAGLSGDRRVESVAGGPSAFGGSDSASAGADPSADVRPIAGGVESAPAGLSADGHPGAGGVESPAGLSADGHPVARGASDPAADGPQAAEPGPAAGSSQSVAAAVAHVLAARAAAHAPEGDRRGDARDRLLAVLLDDPLRAVGAAVDLQDCQERIDRLAAGLKDERGRLGDVLGRLARSGLRPDQLARLSGLSDVEVAEILRRRPTD